MTVTVCPCYRGLRNQAKKLWNKKKKRFSYFTVSGVLLGKLQEKGPSI